ncbi:hypothetical protein PTKIN_Ptkin12aG0037900 [Pterospermum kingtungense]
MEGSALGVRKGAWTAEEDILLKKCIEKYGEGKWHQVPSRAGLNRCRKSCRLRWLNYVKPTIKRGDFEADEVDLLIRLHNLLGNRWSLIAGRLPGRTANDVKNYWNTHLRKKFNPQPHQNIPYKTKELEPTPHQIIPSKPKINVIKPQPRTLSKNSFPVMLDGKNKNNNAAAATVASNNLWWENWIINDNIDVDDQQQGSLQSSRQSGFGDQAIDEELGERRSKVVDEGNSGSRDELFSDVELWNVFIPEPENFI